MKKKKQNQKLTCNKPAEEEEGGEGVPGGAEPAERVGGLVFGLAGAGQAGQQRQDQAEDPQHDQVDGDVGLPRTVLQMDRPWKATAQGSRGESRGVAMVTGTHRWRFERWA